MLIGVVGKANVGKSTFFKAATMAEVAIANYPFTTIKPNKGFGFAKTDCAEKEFNIRCNPRLGYCDSGQRFVPIELLDVAGLVPGAHEGKGMGNQFLDDLRQADALIHIVDIAGTTNEKGEPVEAGSYEPLFDIRFLEVELDMWYLSILKKGWERFARVVQQEQREIAPALAKQLSGLNVTEEMMEGTLKKLNLIHAKPVEWSDEELLKIAVELRRITKPMIIAANKIDLPSGQKNLAKIKEQFPELTVVPCSAESELALKEAAKKGLISYIPGSSDFKIAGELNEKQKKALEFVRENILKKFGSTGVQQVIEKAVFGLLNCIAVFPVPNARLQDSEGRVLPDCFLIPKNSTALDFAYRIHTDIGKKFIRAVDIKTKRTVGKEHVLNNGDVIEIVCGK